ncbi:MAG: hypothetical protein ACTS2F_28900 [Thainema sp.]
MKSQFLVAALLGFSFAVSSCTSLSQPGGSVGDVQAETQTVEPVAMVSQDGSVQITVSDSWETAQLNDGDVSQNMVLKLQNRRGDLQIAIQAFPKVNGLELVDPSVLNGGVVSAAKAMTGSEGTVNPTSLTAISGLTAVQYEGRGKFSGYPVAVLATGVDSPDAYYNILVAGQQSEFDEARAEIDQIVQSFQPAAPEQS